MPTCIALTKINEYDLEIFILLSLENLHRKWSFLIEMKIG